MTDLNGIKEKIIQDPILSKLTSLAKEKDIPLFLVGGHVRDLFLGPRHLGQRKVRKDYDFTLPGEASLFLPLLEQALHLHFFKFGKEERDTVTYRIIQEDMSIDLTFFQGFGIEEDLQRRDFTVNAISFSLRDGTFHWVEGALEDIEKRIIRTVSKYSIDRDPLRMLRAIRYLSTLDGFVIDGTLKEEISQKKELVRNLPGERIRMELDHILLSPQPALGMRFLHEVDLLLALLPELRGLEHLGQNEHHHLNVLPHILLMIEKIPWAFDWVTQHEKEVQLTRMDWLILYFSALFHDIGKQDTYSRNETGRVHFYHHESLSCQRADGIMERLRFSNLMRNRIVRLVQNHMRILNLSQETKEGALKRLVNQMGTEIPLLVLLTLADKEASRGILSVQLDEVIEGHCLRILEFYKEKGIVQPPSLITGYDVMALGYPSGPKVGQILKFIREKQVEGEIKTKEKALCILKERFALGPKAYK
jgi:tRNA nucleotidyltransferase/poly(A) polymerase